MTTLYLLLLALTVYGAGAGFVCLVANTGHDDTVLVQARPVLAPCKDCGRPRTTGAVRCGRCSAFPEVTR